MHDKDNISENFFNSLGLICCNDCTEADLMAHIRYMSSAVDTESKAINSDDNALMLKADAEAASSSRSTNCIVQAVTIYGYSNGGTVDASNGIGRIKITSQ